MSKRSKAKYPRVVFLTKYVVGRVVTVQRADVGRGTGYRTFIRFEDEDCATVESIREREALDAHEVLEGYCEGLDELLEANSARARESALAEIRSMLGKRPRE